MPEFKPLADAMPDGRIAVYIGAAYQYLPRESAIDLHSQLGTALGISTHKLDTMDAIHEAVKNGAQIVFQPPAMPESEMTTYLFRQMQELQSDLDRQRSESSRLFIRGREWAELSGRMEAERDAARRELGAQNAQRTAPAALLQRMDRYCRAGAVVNIDTETTKDMCRLLTEARHVLSGWPA